MSQRIIRNAKIVTATEEFTGCMVIEAGLIQAIERGDTAVPGAEDWAGAWSSCTPTTWKSTWCHARACSGTRIPPP
jgi:hypothetical protein